MSVEGGPRRKEMPKKAPEKPRGIFDSPVDRVKKGVDIFKKVAEKHGHEGPVIITDVGVKM